MLLLLEGCGLGTDGTLHRLRVSLQGRMVDMGSRRKALSGTAGFGEKVRGKKNCGLGFRVGSFVTASRQMSDSQNYQPLGHVSGGHDSSDRQNL